MREFLEFLDLSNWAITLYLESLGEGHLTSFELSGIIPEASPEDFQASIESLINNGLMIQLLPEVEGGLINYISVPPISPIITYFQNINASFPQIQEQIKQMLNKVITQIVGQAQEGGEAESLQNQFSELKRDLEEDVLIQTQDIKDFSEDFSRIAEIKDLFVNVKMVIGKLQHDISSITQTQFATLIKTLAKIKENIKKKIQTLELKKNEERVITVIEEVLKEKLEQMVGGFTSDLSDLITKEFKNIMKPVEEQIQKPAIKKIESLMPIQSEMKQIFQNIRNNLNEKMEAIGTMIAEEKGGINRKLEQCQESIMTNIDQVLENSLAQVSSLNAPIIKCLESYFQDYITLEKFNVGNIWAVTNLAKLKEIIQKSLGSTKRFMTIIAPKIDTLLSLEQIQNIEPSVKVRIASSIPDVNSTVKGINALSNCQYRQLENETIIAMISDGAHLLIGTLFPEKDDENAFIGVGIEEPALINVLKGIITTTWNASSGGSTTIAPQTTTPGPVKPISSTQSFAPKKEIPKEASKPIVDIPVYKPSVSSELAAEIKKTAKEAPKLGVKQPNVEAPKLAAKLTPTAEAPKEAMKQPNVEAPKVSAKLAPTAEAPNATPTATTAEVPGTTGSFISQVQPKAGDPVAAEINTAFNQLLARLPSLNAEEFSKQLQNVVDIILEKKGFSVTMHNIRGTVNEFKGRRTPQLTEEDLNHIFQKIEEWKQKLII